MLMRAGPFSAVNGEGKTLFADVHLALDRGEMVLLEGPSGSGKTTLLRQLVGLDEAAKAERWLGESSFSGTRMPAWRSKVTLLAQDAPIAQGSIDDNLQLAFGLAAGRDRRIDTERRAALMAEVGLDQIPGDREASSLSGGERHRLALVRGLLWDPPVLVADEPLSGLDPERAEICFRLLQQQARRKDRAVLCVLHDPARRQEADRLLVLTRDGIEARS